MSYHGSRYHGSRLYLYVGNGQRIGPLDFGKLLDTMLDVDRDPWVERKGTRIMAIGERNGDTQLKDSIEIDVPFLDGSWA